MLSLILLDSVRGSLQMLSKGNVRAVLQHCTQYFDGRELHPLGDEAKSTILNHIVLERPAGDEPNAGTGDALTWIAFSYKPISKKLQEIFHCPSDLTDLKDSQHSSVLDVLFMPIKGSDWHGSRAARGKKRSESRAVEQIAPTPSPLMRHQQQNEGTPMERMNPSHKALQEVQKRESICESARTSYSVTDQDGAEYFLDVEQNAEKAITKIPGHITESSELFSIHSETPELHRRGRTPEDTEERKRKHGKRADDNADAKEDAPRQDRCQRQGSSKRHVSEKKRLRENAVHQQIFTGMVAVREQPKDKVVMFVQKLADGGVRFTYFSEEPQRESIIFGKRLGLDTDWNCIISLRDPQGVESPHMDGTAKLPRGISNIRGHIAETDNVPLLVPIFCDSTPDTTREMIQIMQENGEVVLCIGSSLNMHSEPAYAQADASFALQPLPYSLLQPCIDVEQRNTPLISSASFVSSPTTGLFPADLTALSCEVFFFLFLFFLSSSVYSFLSFSCLFGCVYQFESLVQITIVSFSCFLSILLNLTIATQRGDIFI